MLVLIIHIGAIMAAFATCITSVASWRTSRNNALKIQEVHVSINSRMDELLRVTAMASKAEGILQQKEAQKEAQKEPKVV